MAIEIMLLGVLIGITLLAYMIAINSHGPTRLSVSYLIATLILAGTVWAIVQYVNYGVDKKQQEKIRNLQLEKQQIEDRARNQEQSFMENRKMSEAANKVKELINQGAGYASTMINVDLRDFSTELDELVGRSNSMKNNIAALETAFENLKNEKSQFPGSVPAINEAMSNLNEAVKYYRLYFRAEDSAQEEIRERVMRQKAREAEDLFKKANSLIASSL